MTLLERLMRNLSAIACQDREHVRVGPFDAFVDHLRTTKYHSLALPDPGATDTDLQPALAPLQTAFAERGRTARTEFAEALTPGLEALLLADGWTLSERTPVMACTPDRMKVPPAVDGLEIVPLGPDGDEALAVEGTLLAYDATR